MRMSIELGQKQGMAPKEFYDLILANGFTLDNNGNITLKSDEEIYEQMKQMEETGQIDVRVLLEKKKTI